MAVKRELDAAGVKPAMDLAKVGATVLSAGPLPMANSSMKEKPPTSRVRARMPSAVASEIFMSGRFHSRDNKV